MARAWNEDPGVVVAVGGWTAYYIRLLSITLECSGMMAYARGWWRRQSLYDAAVVKTGNWHGQ